MPWLEATPMEQRERFIRDQQSGLYTMSELCDRHTISRKTGYKWLARFDAGGRAALGDRIVPAPLFAPDPRGRRRVDLRGPAPASALGPRETPAVARAATPDRRAAGDQHGRRSVGAPGVGDDAAAAPSVGPSGRGAAHDHPPE